MKKSEQRRFAREIASGFRKLLLKKIESVPEDWDGLEIRQLAADLLAEFYVVPLSKGRMKSYQNEKLVRNL